MRVLKKKCTFWKVQLLGFVIFVLGLLVAPERRENSGAHEPALKINDDLCISHR